jgi:hypothetical protein
MSHHVHRVRRRRRAKLARPGINVLTPAMIAIGGGALLLGFALGLFLLTYGPRAYSSWRETRLLRNASALLAQDNFNEA